MIGRIRRSAAAAAVRISLISGGAAMSWLALSAGAATADDGGGLTSLGSVNSVVESVATPIESVVQEVSAPLIPTADIVAPTSSTQVVDLPAVSDVVRSVPQIVGDISAVDAVAPVTGSVDAALSQAPVVNTIVPQGTTAAVTQPVLEVVDSAVAPALPPVQRVVTPVIEAVDPIVQPIVDPVVEVVEPVVNAAAPVVTVPEPVGVIQPADSESEPAQPANPSAAVGAQGEPAGGPTAVAASELPSSGERAPNAQTDGFGSVQLADDPTGPADAPSPASQGADYKLQEAPQFALVSAQPTVDSSGSPAVLSSAGAASSGSSGSSGVTAADAPSFFDFDTSSGPSPQSGYSAALPHGPSFDPGSTPD